MRPAKAKAAPRADVVIVVEGAGDDDVNAPAKLAPKAPAADRWIGD